MSKGPTRLGDSPVVRIEGSVGLGSAILVGLLLVASVSAGTNQLASCEGSALQAAVDQASDGDVIVLPAGTCRWTSTVFIDRKDLMIAGAGIDATVIIDDVPKTGQRQSALIVNTESGKKFRLTKVTFRGGNTEQAYKGTVIIGGSSKAWRIDHVRFDRPKSVAIRIYGHTYGLIDHCKFDLDGTQGIVVFHDNWEGGSYGDRSWASPLDLGSEKAIYIEDCEFENTWHAGALDSLGGGRFVFRRNTVRKDYVATHGTESGGRLRGVRSYEIYDNSFDTDLWFTGVFLRGGTGVVFNNQFRGYTWAVTVTNFRSGEGFSPWGKCDGDSSFDGNQESGYPCLDQVGRSTGQMINGDTPSPGWPQQGADGVYEWGNTCTGGTCDINSDYPDHIRNGRDFFNNTPRPDYSPYAYPHPLIQSSGGSAPDPPSNLRLTPQGP